MSDISKAPGQTAGIDIFSFSKHGEKRGTEDGSRRAHGEGSKRRNPGDRAETCPPVSGSGGTRVVGADADDWAVDGDLRRSLRERRPSGCASQGK